MTNLNETINLLNQNWDAAMQMRLLNRDTEEWQNLNNVCNETRILLKQIDNELLNEAQQVIITNNRTEIQNVRNMNICSSEQIRLIGNLLTQIDIYSRGQI